MESTHTLPNTGSKEKCYFVVKCRNFEALQKCYETSQWACRDRVTPPHPRCILTSRLETRPVVLIFSVNNCHGWHGYCEMISFPIGHDKDLDSVSRGHKSNELIDHSALHDSKPNSCIDMSDSCGIVENQSKSINMSNVSTTGNNQSDTSTDMIDGNGSGFGTKSTSEMTIIDSLEDGGISDSDSKSKTSLTAETVNEDYSKTSTNGGPTEEQIHSEWYYFNVQWKTIYLKEFGQQCLPSSRTDGFLMMNDVKVNQARNWQELPEETGKLMCGMIDDYYSELKRKSQVKLEALASKRPPPYLMSDISESDQSDWHNIVAKIEAELGQVHLACPFGSQRYNLHRTDSDVDVFIVYQARTSDVLGLNPPKQTIKNSNSDGCDYTILEVHRYCTLLATGDPRCVETLFLHQSTVVRGSQQWRELRDKSLLFLTRQCLDKYLRDALGSNGVKQLLRWRQDNQSRNELPTKIYKLVYIIIRLLQNARDIVHGGPLKVYREPNTEEYEILTSIRQGLSTYDDMWLIIKNLMHEVEQGKDSVAMDTMEAEKTAENWLLQLRYHDFKCVSRK